MAVDPTVSGPDSDSEDRTGTSLYTYSNFLDTYLEVWNSKATHANLETVKSFEDVEKIVNSRRDLESANSMEDVVRLLTHRDALNDGEPGNKAAGHGLRLLRKIILFTHAKVHVENRRKLRWLVPTLLDLVENYEKTCGQLDLHYDDDHRLKDVHKKKSSNDERLPYNREVSYIRIKTPELSKRLQEKVFKEISHCWTNVVCNLPDMKLKDILDARSETHPSGNGTDEQKFLNCLAFWIEEHPRVATWTNLVASVAKVDFSLREAVSALKSPS